MDNELQRAKRIMERVNTLAAVSEMPGCIARTYGTDAFLMGRSLVESWMKEAGLQPRTDSIGNLRGSLRSSKTAAKTFVIGSHIDTVINAGKFDGPLGVLAGLDVIEYIIQSGINLPFHIELVAFCDEEGCRFHTTYLGSKVLAGSFDSAVLDSKDAEGISLRDAITRAGGHGNQVDRDAIARNDWLGYFEIHIEQGPVLYEMNVPVALVTAIAGQKRVNIVFGGEAGHAGTVPMNMRNDALTCAAEFILEVEKFAKINTENLVATVGKLTIAHAASNVIPGEVICTLDLRSANENKLSASYDAIKNMAADICRKRNIVLEWNLIQQAGTVTCDEKMNKRLAGSIAQAGYEVVHMVSGAGHDAVPIAGVAPVNMLFVRCFKGISHNPQEDVDIQDLAAAVKVTDNFLKNLIEEYSS